MPKRVSKEASRLWDSDVNTPSNHAPKVSLRLCKNCFLGDNYTLVEMTLLFQWRADCGLKTRPIEKNHFRTIYCFMWKVERDDSIWYTSVLFFISNCSLRRQKTEPPWLRTSRPIIETKMSWCLTTVTDCLSDRLDDQSVCPSRHKVCSKHRTVSTTIYIVRTGVNLFSSTDTLRALLCNQNLRQVSTQTTLSAPKQSTLPAWIEWLFKDAKNMPSWRTKLWAFSGWLGDCHQRSSSAKRQSLCRGPL